MNDDKFVPGFFVKPPHERAPDFVKARISMKRVEMIEWLQGQTDEWINLDAKVSKGGKWYAQVNEWKPEQTNGDWAPEKAREAFGNPGAQSNDISLQDIPF